MGNCDVCGEFDCDIDHDEEFDIEEDDSWFFDGSGMVGDD
jgi:hypothetical protein